MALQYGVLLIISPLAISYGWKYSADMWNKCYTKSHMDLFNRSLNTCMNDCVLRSSCIAVQYERVRKTCGIVTHRQLQGSLKVCRKFIYIRRAEMKNEAISCAPYRSSSVDGSCITECSIDESENLRLYASMDDVAAVGSRVKVDCIPPLTPAGNPLFRCNEDGEFSHQPACQIASDINVALGKPTWESTSNWGSIPSNVVDGYVSTDHFAKPCSHTDHEFRPWWMVDLENEFHIVTVRVYNRQDCCADRLQYVRVYVSATDIMKSHDLIGQFCAGKDGPFVEPVINFNCVDGTRGRFVKIILDRVATLTLCEVEIFVAAV